MVNRRKDTIALLAVLLLSALAAGSASAQIATRRHIVSGFVGAQFFDISNGFNHEASANGSNLDTQIDLGARYQYNFTPHWGAEGTFRFSPGSSELARRGRSSADVDAYYYNGNVIYNILPYKKIVPFATAGIGGVSLDVSRGNTESFLTYNFGGGVLYNLDHRWGVRFDVRDYIYNADDLGPRSRAILDLDKSFDETIHDLAVNAGITFTF